MGSTGRWGEQENTKRQQRDAVLPTAAGKNAVRHDELSLPFSCPAPCKSSPIFSAFVMLLQKLLDAKLKRVAQEGASARAAGRNPLADARDDDRDDATGGWL